MVKVREMLALSSSSCRPCYPLGRFVGVTIHNTGNLNNLANAEAHGKYLLGEARNEQVSWHYAVDETEAVRSIPENEVAWHAGDGFNGQGNRQTIAVEICVNSDGDLLKATNNAAELVADILKRHGIFSADGWIYQHNHWSGKDCPMQLRKGEPYTFSEFVRRVQQCINSSICEEENIFPSSWAAESWKWGIDKLLTDGTNPKEPCTREMAIAMMHRLYNLISEKGLS